MASQNSPGNGPQNPWGQGSGPRSPWGGSGGEPPHDMDEMLRRAQNNLRQVMPGDNNGKLAGLALIGLVALWFASGLFTIEPGEHGVIQRFGAWERTRVDEGLGYHMPWPIETLNTVNVANVREMHIGYYEYETSKGKTKRDIPEESLMLTSDSNIVDLDLAVQWDVKSAEDFLFNIRDPESTIKKVAESAIREVVGQTSMFEIITTKREQVADRAQAIMIKNLDDYKSGVNVKQVLIQEAEVHPDVQNAFQDVQSAKQDAEDVQNRAEAYSEDILPRANGQAFKLKQQAEAYKRSVIAHAEGDASRFEAVYEAYKKGKDVTRTRIYIETMEEVLQNAQKIIMDDAQGGTGVVPYLPLNELQPAAGKRKEK